MKNGKKILALLFSAILLVVASVAGTLAYLNDAVEINNTFTVGKVEITMVETLVDPNGNPKTGDEKGTTSTGNEYKLIPGHTYTKDPTIKVSEGSEDCYILVEIVNELGGAATLPINTGWSKVQEDNITNTYVWVYGTNGDPTIVKASDEAVKPFSTFTFGENADPAQFKDSSIKVKAYAIQADTLESKTAAELWAILKPES